MIDALLEASNLKSESAWSMAIKSRDKKCKHCGSIVGLQACHVVGRSCDKLRLSMLNGVTLCHKCHRIVTDGIAATEEQIMRKAIRNVFGFDLYDVLQALKYDV
jgi:5-methylcytosine-specific restriction endonuclease McrA